MPENWHGATEVHSDVFWLFVTFSEPAMLIVMPGSNLIKLAITTAPDTTTVPVAPVKSAVSVAEGTLFPCQQLPVVQDMAVQPLHVLTAP